MPDSGDGSLSGVAGAGIVRSPGTAASSHAGRVTAERRKQMIATAAYFLAEKRSFQNGDPVQDWLRAEAEIDRKLDGMCEPLAPPYDQQSILEHLELQLWGFDCCVDKLTHEMAAADDGLRDEFEVQKNVVASKRITAEHRLQDLRRHAQVDCRTIRAATGELWQELSHAVDELAAFVALVKPGARSCS